MGMMSECCSAEWDEDTGICMDCHEYAEGVYDNDYEHYEAMAKEEGWTMPVNDIFSEETWVGYWQQMEAHKEGRLEGRPIAPHRSA
jgi:hypothetical protein